MSRPERETEVISRGIVIHADHLLLCRNKKGNYYYLPGGHIEFSESAENALIREMVEETGQELRVGRLVLVTEQHFSKDGNPNHEFNLVFEAELFHVEQLVAAPPLIPPPVKSLEDEIDFHWLSAEAFAACDFRPASIKNWLLKSGFEFGPDRTDWISSSAT